MGVGYLMSWATLVKGRCRTRHSETPSGSEHVAVSRYPHDLRPLSSACLLDHVPAPSTCSTGRWSRRACAPSSRKEASSWVQGMQRLWTCFRSCWCTWVPCVLLCVCHPTHHAYNKWTGGMGLLMCAELFKHAVVCDGPSDTTIMTAFLRRRRWLTHTSTSEQARHGAAPSPHPLPTHHPNRSRCEWKITYIWKLEESTRTFT